MSSRTAHDPDPSIPSPARMYDYWLGGSHNFPADRKAADAVTANYPDAPLTALANRAFLGRAVAHLCAQGIDQFLDIGSGIPTEGNVHTIAQCYHPQAKVVYVDIDPVAVAYSHHILQSSPNVTTIEGDVRLPDEILSHSDTRRLIDFNRPFAVLLVAMLHYVTNDTEAEYSLRKLREALPSGGYLALSHVTNEVATGDQEERVRSVFAKTSLPIKGRSRAEITAFLEGLELVDPGVVFAPQWLPSGPDELLLNEPRRATFLVGVGRKP